MDKLIKFCGICRADDLDACAETKPSHIGFVFYRNSVRYVPADNLTVTLLSYRRKLVDMKRVGVFVDSEFNRIVKTISLCSLDVVQLHGSEDEDYIDVLRKTLEKRVFQPPEIWKAVKVTEENMKKIDETSADLILLDGIAPGSGQVCDWELVKKYRPQKPFVIAGGLDASNILDAVSELNPIGIDLSSGIEVENFINKGHKDPQKMRNIMEILKSSNWFNS